ncbi:MAG: MATE family efflux transporter [bacterium]|nr:MATE family efflux transporter [bacterium]
MNLFLEKEYAQKVALIAYPVVLGMISRTIMSLVDAAMVGRLGAVELAAVGLGGHISMLTVYSFGVFNIGIQALISRRFGEGRKQRCGYIVNNILVFITIIGLSGSILGYFFGPGILYVLADDPAVYNVGKSYVAIRFIEFLSFTVIGIYRGFFDGIGNTKVYMKAMIVMNGMNIVLNYVLIFGNFGFPRLEVPGAAIGSMLSSYAGALVMIFHSLKKDLRKEYGLYNKIATDFSIMKKLYTLNFPEMTRVFLGYGGFLIFLKILGMISTVVLAAGNVCIAIMGFSFMPGYGIGTASATLVGQSLGAKKPDIAEKYGWEAVKIGVIVMSFMGFLFILVPDHIMRIFTVDADIIREGIIALRIIGFVQFFDAFGMVIAVSLQGCGMTKFVMKVETAVVWLLFIPLSYVLGIKLGFGTFGAWLSLAVYIAVFGIVMTITFKRGSWKTFVV